MNALTLLQLVIVLGKNLLSVGTKAQWPQAVLGAISAGITSFESVHSSTVTRDQLESLRVL